MDRITKSALKDMLMTSVAGLVTGAFIAELVLF